MKKKSALLTAILVLLLSTFLMPITSTAITSTIKVQVGESIPLETMIQLPTLKKEAEGLKVKWTSSDSKVALVNYSNKLEGKSKGTAKLTAKLNDVTVAELNVQVISTVTGVKVDKTALSLKTGDKQVLMATVSPSNAYQKKVNWTTSDRKVATVYNGTVNAIGVGKATITATTVDGGYKATTVVSVTSAVTGIQAPNAVSVNVGETKELGATILTNSTSVQKLSYTIGNKEIIRVDVNGKVTGLKEGKTTVVLKSPDGKYSKTMNVTVISNIDSLSIANKDKTKITTLNLKVGEPHQLHALGSPGSLNGYKIAWLASDPKVVTINSKGVVKGLKAGKTTISFMVPQESKSLKVSIVVNVVPTVTGVSLNKKSTKVYVGGEEILIATVQPSNAYLKDVTWKSSNTKVATVSSKGAVKGISAGTVTIQAITKDGEKVASATVTVESLAKGIQVPSTNLKFYLGSPYKFTATVVPDATLVKTISHKLLTKDGSTVVKVEKGKRDGEYVLTGLKAGKTQLELKTKDGNYTKIINIEIMNTPVKVDIIDKNTGKKLN